MYNRLEKKFFPRYRLLDLEVKTSRFKKTVTLTINKCFKSGGTTHVCIFGGTRSADARVVTWLG